MKRGTKNGDWVSIGGAPGEVAHCTRCGTGLRMSMPIEAEVFVAAAKAFVKVHSRCQAGNYIEKPAQTPEQWAAGRDTGISSLTIYSAITGNLSPAEHFDVPHDPSDFGRCYRLLKLFPAWRQQLDKTVTLCPKWKPFVERWEELEKWYLYELENGSGPKYRCYELIKQLERER